MGEEQAQSSEVGISMAAWGKGLKPGTGEWQTAEQQAGVRSSWALKAEGRGPGFPFLLGKEAPAQAAAVYQEGPL